MDASEVYKAVYGLFGNYDYKLMNTYIYDWESDFWGRSKSGYALEVEVKVSRSDFFKDFEKPKHKLFVDWLNKKTHHITKRQWMEYMPERLIGSFINKEIEFQFGGSERSRYHGWRTGMHKGKWGVWVNDFGSAYLKQHEVKMYAQATPIKITPLKDILCPNSLYYACPEGMIKIDEVPKYAGLVYVQNEHCASIVKKAPYIHKNYQNINAILLKKFYYLWLTNVTIQQKMEISLNNKS